ncbi:MAG: hypothetical protein U0835_20115 [Isosphaeraceae bacterium]
MFATMTGGVAERVRQFHEDERGDVMQNICVGGVKRTRLLAHLLHLQERDPAAAHGQARGLLGGNMLSGANGFSGTGTGGGDTGGSLPSL